MRITLPKAQAKLIFACRAGLPLSEISDKKSLKAIADERYVEAVERDGQKVWLTTRRGEAALILSGRGVIRYLWPHLPSFVCCRNGNFAAHFRDVGKVTVCLYRGKWDIAYGGKYLSTQFDNPFAAMQKTLELIPPHVDLKTDYTYFRWPVPGKKTDADTKNEAAA